MKSSEIVRVTKTFAFEMAHALTHYDGDCRNIHGHSYKLAVTFAGTVNHLRGDAKEGMVIDFKDLAAVVKTILQNYDHSLMVNEETRSAFTDEFLKQFRKTRFVFFQPTCENILLEIKDEIIKHTCTNKLSLIAVRLHETATSYAEWVKEDNQC